MRNLAGERDCDTQIRLELSKAGVDIVQLPAPMQSEVPASVIGQLPGFRLHRAWYYWAVQGEVPLDVARKLYNDPNGRKDIRVAGHCGSPPPEEWVEHYGTDGKRLAPKEHEKSLLDMESNPNPIRAIRDVIQSIRESTRFVEDPVKEATKSVVTSYHIDTQEGLNFFVTTLRENGVVPPKEEKQN